MTEPGPVFSSLKRGVLAVAANPALIIAPVVMAVSTVVGILICVGALILPIGPLLAQVVGSLVRGDREQLRTFPSRIVEGLLVSPVLLILSLLVVLAVVILFSLLASYLNAGMAAVLVSADALAPRGARERGAFHVDALGIFRQRARDTFGRFFGLLNLYGLAVVVLMGLFVVAVVALAVGVMQGKFALGILLVLASVPIVVAGSALLRLANVATSRVLSATDLPLLDAVGAGLEDMKRTPGASIGLFLMWIAGSLALSAIFSVPRLLVGFVLLDASGLRWDRIAVNLISILAEWLVLGFLQLAMTGAFFSLWNPARSGTGAIIIDPFAELAAVPAAPPIAFGPDSPPPNTAEPEPTA
ncbi:MAG: hypothetical protein ABIT01_07610 [Thermoanaerobaculia bacterium]